MGELKTEGKCCSYTYIELNHVTSITQKAMFCCRFFGVIYFFISIIEWRKASPKPRYLSRFQYQNYFYCLAMARPAEASVIYLEVLIPLSDT